MLSLVKIIAALPLISALTLDPRNVITHPGGKPSIVKRALVCGTHGYDKEKPQAYFGAATTALKTLTACAAHCLADTKCMSYAFGQGECLHYTAAV
jgi:hypothetical protein